MLAISLQLAVCASLAVADAASIEAGWECISDLTDFVSSNDRVGSPPSPER